MYKTGPLLSEAKEAHDKVWFIQLFEVYERTDYTLSIRLYIRQGLFVHAFIGEITNSLYLALIEGNQRIFGIDHEGGHWHLHSFEAPHKHEPFDEGLGPKPLLAFLSKVEKVLVENNLL